MAGDTSYAAVHYNAGFIVLSYLVSLVGCVTTLELLHRRTSRRGLYNWYLLVSSCICMGSVGIWSMHFIGNRAIEILSKNETGTQILYSGGCTAASFFLPIVVLLVAFYLLGVLDRGHWYFVGLSALLTGTAVCGMHYVGQLGISNYSISYNGQYVAGAGAIAVLASFIALSVFFKLRDTWKESWWKRSLCAAVLAGAVSGMHWTAAAGTNYRFLGTPTAPSIRPQEQTVIVCAVLSIVACVILLGLTMLGGYKKKISRTQAKQLVLCVAYFDEHGRIMVTPEGSLPCEKITDHYIEKTFGEDELNRTHPSFVWVFKASRNWSALKDLIPGMKENIESDPRSGEYYPTQNVSSDTTSSTSNEDFSGMFKKLFCVAALALANGLHEPIETLGPLFEEPLETGTLNNRKSLSLSTATRHKSPTRHGDIERASPTLLGRGQYFFLDRQLSKSDVVKYGARGFRFAAPAQIAESLASSMQIPSDVMIERLDRMRMYCSKENLLPAGLLLTCFFLRPSVQKSFDVLVPSKMQNQLPHIPFTLTGSVQQDLETLKNFDEWTVGDILRALIHQSGSTPTDQSFRWELFRAFNQLVELMADPEVMMEAKFSAKVIPAPCRQPNDGSATSTCTLYSVRHIATIEARSPKAELTYVPLSFFNAQQQLEASPWAHDIFAKQAHLEFAYLGKSKQLVDSKNESRKASVVELSFPLKPASILRQSFGGRHRGTSRLSEGTHEGQNEVANEASNDETVELSPRARTHTLSSGSLRDPGVEDTGTFVSQLFALFAL